MNVQLNTQAAALLKQFQVRTEGNVDPKIEQELSAQVSSPDQVLTAKQVEQALLKAMPEQKAVIKDCCTFVSNYQCDNSNAMFLSQILDTRVEKDTSHVYRAPTPPRPRVFRDPYHADIQMAPDADFLMMFNARDVDKNGQPLLMKIIAREGADLSKIDLGAYRTLDSQTSVDKFDVQTVAKNADFIQMKDTDEAEFSWGDPLLAVSLNKSAKELSATVKVDPENVENRKFFQPLAGNRNLPDMNRPLTGSAARRSNTTVTGDQLDTTGVETFSEKIRLEMSLKDTAPEGAWLNTPGMGQHLDVALNVDPGYMFEPGANARVAFLGTNHDLSIDNSDAQLMGSKGASAAVSVSANYSMAQVLGQNVNQRSHSAATGTTDQTSTNTKAADIFYPNPDKIEIGGAALMPLADKNLTAAQFDAAGISVGKKPLPGDPEHDGQTVSLNLEKGFLKSSDHRNLEGWKVVAGFVDADGTWKQAKEKTIKNKKASEKMDFSFELGDSPKLHQQNKKLEIRLFNADGIPAERVQIPFREIGWDRS